MPNETYQLMIWRARAAKARRVYERTGDRRAKIAEARAVVNATMVAQSLAAERSLR